MKLISLLFVLLLLLVVVRPSVDNTRVENVNKMQVGRIYRRGSERSYFAMIDGDVKAEEMFCFGTAPVLHLLLSVVFLSNPCSILYKSVRSFILSLTMCLSFTL